MARVLPRPVRRLVRPVALTGAAIGGYILSSPLRRTYRTDPPEVWAAAGLAAASGLWASRTRSGLDRLTTVVGAAAAPGFAYWYLHRYSRFDRPVDRLQVGEPFPDFTLSTSDGGTVSLDDVRGRRVVLLTYRGGWCPFCTTELLELRDHYQEILDRKVEVIAVSVDDPEQSEAMRRRVGLDITFASDHDGTLLDALGIADADGLVPGLAAAGFGGSDAVGSSVYLPTTVLLDDEGVVRWVHRAENYRVRATPADVVRAIDEVLPAP